MEVTHPDFEVLDRIRRFIYERTNGPDRLAKEFPSLVREAIEFVLDPVKTARTRITDLDNVEKTFIGLKIEHYFRDLLDVPKGIRDLIIDGLNVDIKNTVTKTWMIPPETFGNQGCCVLIATAESDGYCQLGLIVAREAYLTKPNRDQKRGVGKVGKENIMWLLERAAFPPSRWEGLNMERFRDLRKIKGGKKRAAAFFVENLGRPVHRSILETLLFDQLDFMKRLRGNGGARDELAPMGIALLSGVADAKAARLFGYELDSEEFLAIKPRTEAERAAAGL
jgi:hypothetical protein